MATRSIWKGYITFGLVNIPVAVFPAEKTNDLHFKLVDSRNMAKIHYERINDDTGEEVPWDRIAKAYEYDRGNYVLLDKEEIEKIAAENLKLINIEDFVAIKDLESFYFAKPYLLAPEKGGDKGYVLLRKILSENKKVGIAKIIIRTRQHIAAIVPYKNALILNILRYPQELRQLKDFELPSEDLKKYKISQKEIEMAKQLIDTMTVKWDPKNYHDEYREALMKWIEEKLRKKTAPTVTMEDAHKPLKTAKVVDFMALLKKSLEKQKQDKSTAKKTKTRATKKLSHK